MKFFNRKEYLDITIHPLAEQAGALYFTRMSYDVKVAFERLGKNINSVKIDNVKRLILSNAGI